MITLTREQAIKLFELLGDADIYPECKEIYKLIEEKLDEPWVKTYSGGKPNYTEPCERCGEVNPAEIHTCTPKQPEQELVAWVHPEDFPMKENTSGIMYAGKGPEHWNRVPLYTAPLHQPEQDDEHCQACEGNHCTAKNGCVALDNPPQRKWVSLTDEEMVAAWSQSKGDVLYCLIPFAKAIEAKLREKND